QVRPEALQPRMRSGYDPRPLFEELRSGRADLALASAQVRASDRCVVKVGGEEVPRTASTTTTPGAEICVNPERVAVLGLALGLSRSNRKLGAFGPEIRSEVDLLFGVLMHEIAGQYGRDSDQKFLHAMRREAHRHFVAMRAYSADAAVAIGRTSFFGEIEHGSSYWNDIHAIQLGLDRARSADLSLKLRLAPEAPEKCLDGAIARFEAPTGTVDRLVGIMSKEREVPFARSPDKRSAAVLIEPVRLRMPEQLLDIPFAVPRANRDECKGRVFLDVIAEGGSVATSVDLSTRFEAGFGEGEKDRTAYYRVFVWPWKNEPGLSPNP
ncbi:MAG TPA: hypothetical protein VM598_07610, partial [Bdellovibrionota bacterium]|nr:hypothetical protein [Bdellovibrionota bacterium]